MIGLGSHPRWSRVGTQVCLGLLRLSIKFSVSADTLLLKTLNENGNRNFHPVKLSFGGFAEG